MNKVPLLSTFLKLQVSNKKIELSCNYAGCGSADSWPKTIM